MLPPARDCVKLQTGVDEVQMISSVDAVLYKAYLDCLFLDRETLSTLNQEVQSYESAVLAAHSLLDHMRMHPRLSNLNLPENQSIKAKELPVLLDYIHRALWRLLQRGTQENFLQTLQQELAYLIPRLWHPPKTQQQEIAAIKENLRVNANLFENTELLHALDNLEAPSAAELLQYVDESLLSAWPKQLGIIMTKDANLRQHIQAHSQVEGIEWLVFEDLSQMLQTPLYQEPNMVLIGLDQPRVSLDRVLNNFPRSEVIGVVKAMAQLKSHMLPTRVQHILEEQWLAHFLPGLIQRNLRQRWKDVRNLSRDFLTGLPSLMGMREQYSHLKSLFSRVKSPMTLAVLEVPILKQIEAQEGPYLASEWLKSFARFMQSSLRTTDFIGRWIPDKFVCLLPQTHLEGAQIALMRCLERLPQELSLPPQAKEGNTSSLIFCGGLAMMGQDTHFEHALHNAYMQLELSKQNPQEPFAYSQEELKASVKPHILLLDDDPIIQEMLRFVFSREGYTITQLTNGKHILEALNKNPTSLVLLDIMMPGMDGFEVLETIRSQRQFDQLPVVILSSMKGENDLEKGFSLGADDYIYKPFSPSELVIRIRRFLQ